MVGLPWKNLPSMQANLDGLESKSLKRWLFVQLIGCWLEEKIRHGKGQQISKAANYKQWRKGKKGSSHPTVAEAPRGFRSTTWSIPFLSLVTSAAALCSLSAPELFINSIEETTRQLLSPKHSEKTTLFVVEKRAHGSSWESGSFPLQFTPVTHLYSREWKPKIQLPI